MLILKYLIIIQLEINNTIILKSIFVQNFKYNIIYNIQYMKFKVI